MTPFRYGLLRAYHNGLETHGIVFLPSQSSKTRFFTTCRNQLIISSANCTECNRPSSFILQAKYRSPSHSHPVDCKNFHSLRQAKGFLSNHTKALKLNASFFSKPGPPTKHIEYSERRILGYSKNQSKNLLIFKIFPNFNLFLFFFLQIFNAPNVRSSVRRGKICGFPALV